MIFIFYNTFTQSFNLHSYCLNNPLKYTNPDGKWVWAIPNLIAIFGIGNTVAHATRGDINNVGDGLKYFAQGAVAGYVLSGIAQYTPMLASCYTSVQANIGIGGTEEMKNMKMYPPYE